MIASPSSPLTTMHIRIILRCMLYINDNEISQILHVIISTSDVPFAPSPTVDFKPFIVRRYIIIIKNRNWIYKRQDTIPIRRNHASDTRKCEIDNTRQNVSFYFIPFFCERVRARIRNIRCNRLRGHRRRRCLAVELE